ncbi:hypothetical protein GIB67_003393, partial [Kingdonia uniflora]
GVLGVVRSFPCCFAIPRAWNSGFGIIRNRAFQRLSSYFLPRIPAGLELILGLLQISIVLDIPVYDLSF